MYNFCIYNKSNNFMPLYNIIGVFFINNFFDRKMFINANENILLMVIPLVKTNKNFQN